MVVLQVVLLLWAAHRLARLRLQIHVVDIGVAFTGLLLFQIVVLVGFRELEDADWLVPELGFLEHRCADLGLPVAHDFLPFGLHLLLRAPLDLTDVVIDRLLELIVLASLLADAHVPHFRMHLGNVLILIHVLVVLNH